MSTLPLYPAREDFIVVAGRWSDRALTRHVKRAILGTGFPARSFTAPRDAGIDASDQGGGVADAAIQR